MKRFSLASVLFGAFAGALVGATGTVALLLALGAPPPARESDPSTRPPASPAPRQAPHRHPTPTPTSRPDPSVTALAIAEITRIPSAPRAPRSADELRMPDFMRSAPRGARVEQELRIPEFTRSPSSPPPRRCDFLPGSDLRVPEPFMQPGVTYQCEPGSSPVRRPAPRQSRR